MREPKNVRDLAAGEIAIAKDVYKDRIPYDSVLISDGLGGDDRPFTVPTILPIHIPFYANFNVKGDGKYVIRAAELAGLTNWTKIRQDYPRVGASSGRRTIEVLPVTYVVFSLKDRY
jgi:hypothetical protein